VETLHRLKDLGVRISIDDFGTGYSSLSYLHRFPIDTIKIDRSFVSGVASDKSSAGIVRAIIAVARELKLTVVAEGVETEEQLRYLRQQRCDMAQGYLLGRPAPVESLAGVFANVARVWAAVDDTALRT
jgi:EAL domain-containing protein (putative c-di-GMP-specific phosphodiesterase class I)